MFKRRDLWLLFSLYLAVVAGATAVLRKILEHAAATLHPTLLAGFQTGTPTYKTELVTFVILVLTLTAGLALGWLFRVISPRKTLPAPPAMWIAAIALIGCVVTSYLFTRSLFALALLIALGTMFLPASEQEGDGPAVVTPLPLTGKLAFNLTAVLMVAASALAIFMFVRAWYPVTLPNDYYEIADTVSVHTPDRDYALPRAIAVACMNEAFPERYSGDDEARAARAKPEPQLYDGKTEDDRTGLIRTRPIGDAEADEASRPAVAAARPAAEASRPAAPRVEPRTAAVPAHAGPKPIAVAVAELEAEEAGVANAIPVCPYKGRELQDIAESLPEDAIRASTVWQGTAGRLLYHHAYVLVPVRHFMTYGFTGATPHLYGYGTTLFYAAAFSVAGDSMTTYFNTIPLTFVLGLLAIALLVGWGARSWFVGVGAFLAASAAFFWISFDAALLAPGFTPLRYFGLLLQIASIFYLFRSKSSWRGFVLPLTLAASFVWNSEYALLGSFGQGLALLSPQLDLKPLRRFVPLVLAIAIAIGTFLFSRVGSPDILSSIQLGFFNISVPGMERIRVIRFFVGVILGGLILTFGALQFSPKERDARLAILPIVLICFIKYLFNPSPPHLAFVDVLVAPMAALYFPWQRAMGLRPETSPKGFWLKSAIGCAVSASCVLFASSFLHQADSFRARFIAPYGASPWTGLGETVPIGAAEAPILARVTSIRANLEAGQGLLAFSPFDHVVAYYVNPPRYCGHFEMLTNLTRQGDMEYVRQCLVIHPDTLVVYDAAMNAPCLTEIYSPCEEKRLLKQTLQSLFDYLEPELREVGRAGDLVFYRFSGSSGARPRPQEGAEEAPAIAPALPPGAAAPP